MDYNDKLPRYYLDDLESGYYRNVDGNKCLKPKFIVDYPRKIAQMMKDKNKNKLSQIWKFYDYARKIQDSLKQQEEPFAVIEAELDRLKPAAAYAVSRDTVTYLFRQFIDENVSQIKETEDLEAFIKHFQSVIAYLPRGNQK